MSRTLVVLLFLTSLLTLTCGVKLRFENHHVYQITPNDLKQLDLLKSLDGASEKLVFLEGVHGIGQHLNVIVPPTEISAFLQKLDKSKITYKLIEKNAQSKLESEEDVAKPLNSRSIKMMDYSFAQYHELNETYSWLESLAVRFPKIVTLIEAGKSYEGRKIMGIKISHKKGNKAIFLEGGMHAREWISPATVVYIANKLLTSYDLEVKSIAKNFDWYIIPHANPDGYVFTHTKNRVWRKNRTPFGSCFGVDLNRNWDFHWNEVAADIEPCSDTYAGPKAFSEIETKSLSEFIASIKDDLILYISYHSYAQLLLFPYGHTSELPSNYADIKRVYDVAVSAIGKRYGTKYNGGNVYEAIYPAAGSSMEWVYGKTGVNLTYSYELRPSNTSSWNGFRLPANEIIPTAEETLDSLVAMVNEATLK